MKPCDIRKAILGASVAVLASGAFAATNLLPGITLFDYPPAARGHLIFLIAPPTARENSQEMRSTLYALDLATATLLRVAQFPQFGHLTVSPDGNLFCVSQGSYVETQTLAYVYSTRLSLLETAFLPRGTECVFLKGDNAYFRWGQTVESSAIDG